MPQSAPTHPDSPTAEQSLATILAHLSPERLAHTFACPASSSGPCTCGAAELQAAVEHLKAAHRA